MRLEIMQPLIDQGRTVWLWPDKDGREAWQEVAEKLGSDKVNVYTAFFDTCWREADGDKADCADIIIRMMTKGDQPREVKHTGDPQPPTEVRAAVCAAATPEQQKPDGISDEDWNEHLQTMAAIFEWQQLNPNDVPFIDHEELADPRVREWREILSRVHSSGWRH